jgi:hypothetical protein
LSLSFALDRTMRRDLHYVREEGRVLIFADGYLGSVHYPPSRWEREMTVAPHFARRYSPGSRGDASVASRDQFDLPGARKSQRRRIKAQGIKYPSRTCNLSGQHAFSAAPSCRSPPQSCHRLISLICSKGFVARYLTA